MPDADEVVSRDEIEQIRRSIIYNIEYQGSFTEVSDANISEEDVSIIMSILRMSELRLNIRDKIEELKDEASKDMEIVKEDLLEEWNINESDFEKIEDLDEMKQAYQKGLILNEVSGQITEFIVTSQILIEEASVELLREELIDERYKESSDTDTLLNRRMSQREREELLLRTGIIDSGLKGEMKNIRTTRNNLAHKVGESILLESIDDLSSELDRTLDTVNKIRGMLSDNTSQLQFS